MFIKYNIYNVFEKIYFHMRKCKIIYKSLCFTCEHIEYNVITSAFTVDSKAQNVGIHMLNWIVRHLLVIKLSRYVAF